MSDLVVARNCGMARMLPGELGKLLKSRDDVHLDTR